MIVSVHQPHFLPWLGYFNKVASSDVFVWLHTVQYRKNYYQNRTRIRNENHSPLWLTVPVHAPFGVEIDKVVIADGRWIERISRTVEQCYRKSKFYAACWPLLAQALEESTSHLDDVNFRTFRAVLDILGISSTRIVRAGDIASDSPDPTERLLSICRHVGATSYIAGKGGRNYLRAELFEASGIRVLWQEFDAAKVAYPQPKEPFLPGLSVLDCLFTVGPEHCRDLIVRAWTPNLNTP